MIEPKKFNSFLSVFIVTSLGCGMFLLRSQDEREHALILHAAEGVVEASGAQTLLSDWDGTHVTHHLTTPQGRVRTDRELVERHVTALKFAMENLR